MTLHFRFLAQIYLCVAPRVGFEPTTLRLTAECSAAELTRNIQLPLYPTTLGAVCQMFLHTFLFVAKIPPQLLLRRAVNLSPLQISVLRQ